MNFTTNGSNRNRDRIFKGGSIYVARFRGTVSATAYECSGFGITRFTVLVHRPVFKSNIISRQGSVATFAVKIYSSFTQPLQAELLSTASLLLASCINLITGKIIGIESKLF